ncbi:hypothetical protein GW756_04285 [bacterium]|nr:hypothetical protein [bacterium]NCQ55182.1 hypothetical protein [Candidatus Parcubacteria bacterium]NCS67305.1 hypothetical protein [Candidatus Peregrinibacteria bacterium]NCS96560.1 hypothetical protein [bacterium]
MERKKYLVDETVFVYLDRDEDDICPLLAKFLEGGKLSKRRKEGLKYELYMPSVSKYRLGGTFFYRLSIYSPRRNKEAPLLKAKQISYLRFKVAKLYISGTKKLMPWNKFFYEWRKMNLYIDANTKKSQHIKETKKRKMLPSEVIPFDMCEIALIAKKENMELLSFNTDYKFLYKISGNQVIFRYENLVEFLKRQRD